MHVLDKVVRVAKHCIRRALLALVLDDGLRVQDRSIVGSDRHLGLERAASHALTPIRCCARAMALDECRGLVDDSVNTIGAMIAADIEAKRFAHAA